MKQNQSTWQIFLVVLFSVLSSLIIGTALGSIDYGGNPSISTYLGMFLAQFFIVVPVILLLKKNNLNIAYPCIPLQFSGTYPGPFPSPSRTKVIL